MRTLVALEGGPKSKFWYWSDDWDKALKSAASHYLRPDQSPPDVLRYQPTDRYIDNPDKRYGQGQVWIYQAPAARSGAQKGECPKCLLPCPRIIRWKTAIGEQAECPRCLHLPYREGGTWHHTMPAKDLRWYEERGLL